MQTNLVSERRRWHIIAIGVICGAMSACAESGNDGDGDGGISGSCPQSGDAAQDVRIHVVNSENVANVRVTISTPSGSCAIDPLPTATQNGGLELGQAVYRLAVGDAISLTAQSPSGGQTGECRVNEEAFTEDDVPPQPNSIFIDLFVTTGGFVCSSGVDPA